MKIDFKQVGKIVLGAAGILLPVATTIIGNMQTEEIIDKKVTEALAKKAKES